MSMQSLNGASYQGAQVGANVQSQVGQGERSGREVRVQGLLKGHILLTVLGLGSIPFKKKIGVIP